MVRQKPQKYEETFELPEKVSAAYEKGILTVTGPKGEAKKYLHNPKVMIKTEGNTIYMLSEKPTKREKKMVGTYKAHIHNMIKGVVEGHVYKLKICSGHFPMNVSVTKQEFVMKNFLGEKNPRKLTLSEGVQVTMDGDIITVESVDKERAGQQAASIESLCRITNRDLRVFQDGVWIIKKGEKDV